MKQQEMNIVQQKEKLVCKYLGYSTARTMSKVLASVYRHRY